MAEGESKWFRLTLVLSQPPTDSASWKPNQGFGQAAVRNIDGHISERILSDALSDEAADAPPSEDDPSPLVLCCGPEGFNTCVLDILQRLGTSRSHVYVF